MDNEQENKAGETRTDEDTQEFTPEQEREIVKSLFSTMGLSQDEDSDQTKEDDDDKPADTDESEDKPEPKAEQGAKDEDEPTELEDDEKPSESDSKAKPDTKVKKGAEKPVEAKGEGKDEAPFKISGKDIRLKKADKPTNVADATKDDPFSGDKTTEKPKEKVEQPAKEELDTTGLDKKQLSYVQLAQFGEESEVTDKGTAKNLVDYFRKRNDLREKLIQDNDHDPDYEVDKDPKYRRWHKDNTPPIEAEKFEEIKERKIIARAREEAEKSFSEKYSKLEEENRRIREEQERNKRLPEIRKEVETFSDEVLSEMPDEVKAALKDAKNWKEVEEKLPLEAPVVQQTLTKYSDAAQSFVEYVNGLRNFDPKDPNLQTVNQIIKTDTQARLRSPEKAKRNGKEFVPLSTKDFDPSRHWTYSKRDILFMLRKTAGREAKHAIEGELSRLKRLHRYIPQGTQTTKGETTDDDKPSGGRTSVKPSASGGTPSGEQTNQTTHLRSILSP